MKTFNEGGSIGLAAMKAGMDRKTARRYLRIGDGPNAPKPPTLPPSPASSKSRKTPR